jgi:hypothetical protein
LFFLFTPSGAFGQIHHQLAVTVHPRAHRISVVDEITLPEGAGGPLLFRLHQGLGPELPGAVATLRKIRPEDVGHPIRRDPTLRDRDVPLEYFAVDVPAATRSITLRYGGEIFHPIEQHGEEYARSFGVSPGLISAGGVFLSGSSSWYPHVADALLTFDLHVTLPKGWVSISQGRRAAHATHADHTQDSWVIDVSQEEIYLIAGPFTEYHQAAGSAEAMVFLRGPDAQLAQKYLDATAQYLDMYRELLGPYPYGKFALVENFWETGYGMPSFTLLGPTVIRFPFIVHSSYPHEILHNWWGNGVYVDYDDGNWAEGLTSYLADHLMKEQRGEGAEYRRAALQRYTDYVRAKRDFPLAAFRGRHSSVTEAVGYGKSLLLFHMLRRELGDADFTEGLRRFFRRYRFKIASFEDLGATFDEVSDQSLRAFFEQWVHRTGAPSLQVQEATATSHDGAYVLSVGIEQVQDGPPYRLRLPMAVHLVGTERAHQTDVVMETKRHRVTLQLPARPVRLDVDPEFDVFRRLDRNELPPAITQALGAERALVVLPSNAPEDLRQGYATVARAWQQGRVGELDIGLDNELTALPRDRSVWLFGWENRFRPVLETALTGYDFAVGKDAVRIDTVDLTRAEHAAVVLARLPANPEQALGWVATDNLAALPGLGRKLPHYGKYSYLGFVGDEPANVLKGQWPVVNSPMSVAVEQSDGKRVSPGTATLAPRPALAQLPAVFSAERIMRNIAYLAASDMAGRGLGTAELDRAAEYIAGQFRAAGLQAGGDVSGDYFQSWTAQIGTPPRTARLKNVSGVIPGTNPRWEGQSVVIGAHYDHLGRGWPDVHAGDEGKIHPGADDNASGVAVLLELARTLGDRWRPERSVVFVAFTGEEAGRLGSAYYVQHAKEHAAEKVMGMLNIDTVGRLGSRDLLVLGAGSAREWAHIFRGAGFVTGVPVKAITDDFGSSDQASFIEAGVPAVQLFAGPHPDVHRPTDTTDQIDTAGLVRTAAVLKEAVEYLASRAEPLTSTLAPTGEVTRQHGPASPRRRVVLGTVPDFAYTGKGMRLSGVSPGTPAAEVGLQEGDVIVQLNDASISNLRDVSDVLRALQAGDKVTIRIVRDGSERVVSTTVVER